MHRLSQVAYHEQAVVVPFQITQSALRVPISVPYTVRSLVGSNLTAFIHEQYTEGLLEWDQPAGGRAQSHHPRELDSHPSPRPSTAWG